MAYYDNFTKKPRDKRQDLRNDEETRRPAGDRYRRTEDDYRQAERRYGGSARKSGTDGRSFRPYGEEERSRADRRRDERFSDRRTQSGGTGKGVRGAPAPRDDRRALPREGSDRKPAQRFSPDPERRNPAPFPKEETLRENWLVGRNPIREALKSGRDLEKLIVARGEIIGSGREILAMARERKIVIQEVDRARLDAMAPGHQGMIAVASAYAYSNLDEILSLAASRGEAPFVVVLDGITDPHNLGAIIRTAECAGAHGVIIPERRAVGLTPAAVKASAGAVEHIPVARETNIARTLDRLKGEGFWVFGSAADGEDYRSVDFSGPCALVVGSEGEGISRLVREKCDRIVSLPVKGKIDSLNASVAAGILLYAISARRDAP